jgi:hypothetical protein
MAVQDCYDYHYPQHQSTVVAFRKRHAACERIEDRWMVEFLSRRDGKCTRMAVTQEEEQ